MNKFQSRCQLSTQSFWFFFGESLLLADAIFKDITFSPEIIHNVSLQFNTVPDPLRYVLKLILWYTWLKQIVQIGLHVRFKITTLRHIIYKIKGQPQSCKNKIYFNIHQPTDSYRIKYNVGGQHVGFDYIGGHYVGDKSREKSMTSSNRRY